MILTGRPLHRGFQCQQRTLWRHSFASTSEMPSTARQQPPGGCVWRKCDDSAEAYKWRERTSTAFARMVDRGHTRSRRKPRAGKTLALNSTPPTLMTGCESGHCMCRRQKRPPRRVRPERADMLHASEPQDTFLVLEDTTPMCRRTLTDPHLFFCYVVVHRLTCTAPCSTSPRCAAAQRTPTRKTQPHNPPPPTTHISETRKSGKLRRAGPCALRGLLLPVPDSILWHV